MSDALTNGLVGWSVGYTYATEKKREDEIKQGKNYYLASISQAVQLSQIGILISKINDILPDYLFKTAVKIFCNIGPIISFPAFLYCSSVKQGQNEDLAKYFNGTKYAYIKAPEKLGARTISVLGFISEHIGNMIRVAMVAASVALIVLGNAVYGAAVLTALAYEAVDTMGFIPRRISLFMEIYMPMVSLVGLVIGGTAIVRVFSAIMLSTHIFPFLSKYIHYQVDAASRYFFKMQGPSLKEIDAPVVEKKSMTYDEIKKILDTSSNEFSKNYEINPAHCGVPLLDIGKFQKDHKLEKLLPLFDQIDWKGKYGFIKSKLRDDDRFLDFLMKEFPVKQKNT